MTALDPSSAAIPDRIGPAAARIAAIVRRQHGVISRAQLVEAGMPPSTLGEWTRAGHLHRLYRGVYAVGHLSLTRDGRYMAAVLAGGPGAALSHDPATRILGLDLRRGVGQIHLSMPRSNKRSPSGVIVHRPRRLERIDLIARSSIQVTTATRTIFDMASIAAPSVLRRLFERAEYLEELDRPRLKALLDRAGGRKGLGELRRLTGYAPIPLSRTRSKLERIVLSLCRTYSLPIPGVNVPLLGLRGRLLLARRTFRRRGRRRPAPRRATSEGQRA